MTTSKRPTGGELTVGMVLRARSPAFPQCRIGDTIIVKRLVHSQRWEVYHFRLRRNVSLWSSFQAREWELVDEQG